ncbi:MAG: hypothetical protein ACOC10_03390 [Bacteroidota bacterium]
MNNLKFYIIIIGCLAAFSGRAQESPLPDELINILELYYQRADAEEISGDDLDALYDHFLNLMENPVDINQSDRHTLKLLYVLSDFQIHSLMNYREEFGPIYSLHESNLIVGFNEETVKSITPFIALKPSNIHQKIKSKPRHEIMARGQRLLEKQAGYSDDYYLGDPNKVYLRYRTKIHSAFSAGFTLEKDPGEYYFHPSNSEKVDFLSAHIGISNKSFLKELIVGDYRATIGQGLLLWQGFQGNIAMGMQNQQVFTGIRPYTSSAENNFMRGLGTTLEYNNWALTLLFSQKKIDANVTAIDSTGAFSGFSSIQASGLHNTENLLADKDAILEKLGFLRIERKFNMAKIGINALHHRYNASFQKSPEPYNYYAFTGNDYSNFSIDYRANFKRFSLSGEEVWGMNKGKAFLNSLNAFISPEWQVSLLHRHYSKDYFAHYAQGFGENSNTTNETGFFFGSTLTLFSRLVLKGYIDFFRFPWLKYGVDSPSEGREYMLEANYPMNNFINFRLQNRFNQKPGNMSDAISTVKQQHYISNNHASITTRIQLNTKWQFSTRADYKVYHGEVRSTGWLMIQDIKYTSTNNKLAMALRTAWFDTDDFQSRIYAYENDLAYVFSIPAYFHKGLRYYIVLRYKPAQFYTIYMKAGQFWYPGKSSISSGPNTIHGSTKSEIKIQNIFRF